MKICVIGLGSMGRRRIRLLLKNDMSNIIVGVDNDEARRNTCETELNITTYDSLATAILSNSIDCAFVCTSPLTHNEIIKQCIEANLHVFTELNLVSDGYDDNIALAKEKNKILFMSSTFLYREEIKKIKSIIKHTDSKLNYNYHVGQYLPDWHPWESYLNFFVGNKRTNACREIFAIELPWLLDVFGDIDKVDVVKDKNSDLQIDYNDNYLLLIQHKSGHKGTLAIDVLSRKAVRNIDIYGETLYLHWNGSPTGLFQYDLEEKKDINIKVYEEIDQLENYSSFIVENAYMNEILAFFDAIMHDTKMIYDFERDKYILQIIDRIEGI